MKKALVLLLILAVAGGAFAQGLTLTGDIFSGVNLAIVDVDGVNPSFGLANAEGNMVMMNLTGRWVNEDDTAGVRFQIRGQRNTSINNNDVFLNDPFRIQWAYAWVRAMDGMLTLYGGKLDQSGFATGGGVDHHLQMHGSTGLRLDIAAMDTLTLGLGVFSNQRFDSFTERSELGNVKFNFHFNFLVPDTIRVIGGFTTVNDYHGWDAVDGKYKSMKGVIGFQILALRSAGFNSLILDAEFGRLNDFSDNGYVTVGQRVVYGGIEDVELGLRAVQRIPMHDNEDLGMSFYVWGVYSGLGNIIPRLDFGFDMGTGFRSVHMNGPRQVWDSLNRGGMNSDNMNMVIRPSVQLRVANNQAVDIGYSGQIDMSSPTPSHSMVHNIFIFHRVSF